MQYIVSSRGRPIGTTDLDFIRIEGSNRSGWFHPNSIGEELMPAIAMVLPAVRAFLCRNVRDADGQPVVQPHLRHSALFADLAEAFHRVDAFDLTLHDANGTLVPTSHIGIQDTEQLLELGRYNDVHAQSDPLIAEEAAYEEFDCEFVDDWEHDLQACRRDWRESDDDVGSAIDDMWDPDDRPSRLPRYQVHVLLVEENSIV